MPRIGIRNLHVFKLKEDTTTKTTYDTAVSLPLVTEVGVTPQADSSDFYADDALKDAINVLSKYDITISLGDLTPENQSLLLGQPIDSKGVVFQTAELNQPYFAVAFEALRSDGAYEYRQMFKVRFAPTEENYTTKGESVEFQTVSLTGTSATLNKPLSTGEHAFSNRVVGSAENKDITDKWYTTVYTDLVATTSSTKPKQA